MNAAMTIRVADLMTSPVLSVTMDAKFADIRTLMEKHKIHHLPVVDDNKLMGIISDRDLLRVLSPFLGTAGEMQRDLEALNKVAHQIMTRQPICVSAEDSVDAVLAWLQTVDISCVLVTGKEKDIKGIVTWRDLIKHAKFTIDT
ncbi:CBS domain-containing protein [Marinomonas sp. 15G1-11]|uniref:CBS domain-containing protein n=1 Tax=Marinomonas phaeophyticola TaxID=3004091 RepID=A0ABT4JSH6_9GAMM|nr:CBS domain-containing protein [Marinomonas sp. 15G1-11]MCZ2720992.1 CBS domain-containing protein [Marinomonas sp. 15G1-11]